MKEYYIFVPILILLNIVNHYFTLNYLQFKVNTHTDDGFIIISNVLILISSLLFCIFLLVKKKYISSLTLFLIFISAIYWFIQFSNLQCKQCIAA